MWQRITWLGLAVLVASLVFMFRIDEFLSTSHPVDGDILVVEGWIWYSSALEEAAQEFNRGQYKWLVTVGPSADGGDGIPHQTVADFAARQLRDLGVDVNRIIVLSAPRVKRHRTYTSALMVKSWLIKSRIQSHGVNIFTRGVHAKRSLIFFKRALGPQIDVGVIAGTEDSYDANRWWKTTKGFFEVMKESFGCLHAVLVPLPENLHDSPDSGSAIFEGFHQLS